MKYLDPWSQGVERNIGFLCTICKPLGLKGLIFVVMKSNPLTYVVVIFDGTKGQSLTVIRQ